MGNWLICSSVKMLRCNVSSSDRRVVEIALNAGYDSASKFTEAFKKATA